MQSSLIRLPGKPLVCEDWGFGERRFKTEMSLGFQPGYFVCVSEYTRTKEREGRTLNLTGESSESVINYGFINECVCGLGCTAFFSNPNKYVNVSVFTALLKVSTWKEVENFKTLWCSAWTQLIANHAHLSRQGFGIYRDEFINHVTPILYSISVHKNSMLFIYHLQSSLARH